MAQEYLVFEKRKYGEGYEMCSFKTLEEVNQKYEGNFKDLLVTKKVTIKLVEVEEIEVETPILLEGEASSDNLNIFVPLGNENIS